MAESAKYVIAIDRFVEKDTRCIYPVSAKIKWLIKLLLLLAAVKLH